MDSADDKHIETVEYVKHCDMLLERMMCLSEQLEKDYSTCNGRDDDANSNYNDNKFFETEQLEATGKGSNYCSDDMSSNKLKSPNRPTELSSNIDKITNYRYSFYENSNKISIYVASSSVITQAVSFLFYN